MTSCLCCRITGRVQGVWYRDSTRKQARALGITGYARNLSDGSVEVLACGEEQALQQLQNWLKQGPPRARVEEVTCENVALQAPASFVIG